MLDCEPWFARKVKDLRFSRSTGVEGFWNTFGLWPRLTVKRVILLNILYTVSLMMTKEYLLDNYNYIGIQRAYSCLWENSDVIIIVNDTFTRISPCNFWLLLNFHGLYYDTNPEVYFNKRSIYHKNNFRLISLEFAHLNKLKQCMDSWHSKINHVCCICDTKIITKCNKTNVNLINRTSGVIIRNCIGMEIVGWHMFLIGRL